jgi:hypothetical protein
VEYKIVVKDDGTAVMRKFTGESKNATSAMDRFKSAAATAAKTASILGGGAIAAGGSLFAMAKKTAEVEDRVGKLSQRIGFSTESISAYGHAAQLSGLSTAEFETSLDQMNVRLGEAREGSGKARQAYDELAKASGVMIDLTADNETILKQTADAMQKIDDPSKKAALAVDIFGRSGRSMVGLLQQGSSGLDDMRKEADKFGATISGKAAKNSADFNDSLLNLKTSFAGLTRDVAGEFIPQITDIMKSLSETVMENKDVFVELGTTIGASIKSITPILESTIKNVSWFAKQVQLTLWHLSKEQREFAEEEKKRQADIAVMYGRRINVLLDEQKELKKGSEQYKKNAEAIKMLAQAGSDAGMALMSMSDASGAKFKEFFDKFLPVTEQTAKQVKRVVENTVKEVNEKIAVLKEEQPPIFGPSESDFLAQRQRIIDDAMSLSEELLLIQQYGYDESLMREEQTYLQKRKLLEQSSMFIGDMQEALDALDEQYNARQVERARATEEAKRAMVAGTIQNAINLGKEVFGKNKLFAIADIAMSTYRGIMAAMADPVMPFPLKVVNASMVGAMGLAQANKVRAQKFITGGIVSQRGQMIQVAEDGNPESVINATGTRLLGASGVRALNQGRATDLLNMIAENTGRGNGGVNINISSTILDKRFLEDVLMPEMNKIARRF